MGQRASILVVDDSPTILKVVGGILTRGGFAVELARDGAAGIEMMRAKAFDLVLLDFVMPRMNGYQFCRELRDLPGERARTPVVLMSAKTDRIRGQFVQQTGALDAITKPFDERSLIAVAEGALAKAKVRTSTIEVPRLPTDPPPSEVKLTISGEHALVREALAGDIAILPIAEILQLLAMQRQTGLVRVTGMRIAAHVSLVDGAVALARIEGGKDDHRFGKHALEAGLVTREAFDGLTALGLPPGKRIGGALVERNLLDATQVRTVLERQTTEAVYELVRWTTGTFVFMTGPLPAEADEARLGMGLSGLLLEGFRRVDEWRVMEPTIVWDRVVVADPVREKENASRFTPAETRVIAAADGVRNVSAIIETSGVAKFEAVRAVYQLLRSGVLRSAT
jgi:CheY-like chemotaxis protein